MINSCSYPELILDEIVYENNFENNNDDKVDGATFMNFNSSTVLENFNNDGFILHIDNTKDHDYITLSFDLYIHGSWDGNFNGFENDDKPDKWIT